MKRAGSLFALLFPIVANCQTDIQVAGSMSKIMRKADFSAHLDLDTIRKENLYALGPVQGLKGEIMVVNGKVYVTAKEVDGLRNRKDVSKAAMLVYAYVPDWYKGEAKLSVSGFQDLEKKIESMAIEAGVDLSRPFVFRIEGKAKKVSYHVIDWEEGVSHTAENHKQFAYAKSEEEKEVILLGFYSDHHHSIFTHHTTNMHIHVLNKETGYVGHLDDIAFDNTITIYFSK